MEATPCTHPVQICEIVCSFAQGTHDSDGHQPLLLLLLRCLSDRLAYPSPCLSTRHVPQTRGARTLRETQGRTLRCSPSGESLATGVVDELTRLNCKLRERSQQHAAMDGGFEEAREREEVQESAAEAVRLSCMVLPNSGCGLQGHPCFFFPREDVKLIYNLYRIVCVAGSRRSLSISG